MANHFRLSIVAPDRTVAELEAQSVIAPGVEGYLGIMAGHVPMIVALRTGLIEYLDAQNQRHYVATTGGFMEVGADSVIILGDNAELATDIDIRDAESALESARAALKGESSEMTTEQATVELDRALVRVKAAKMVL